ncbi:MAG: glycerate kinase [Actinomycetes bacterium]
MRVLIAPDKFAGTLSAVEVCDAAASGWHDVAPRDVVLSQPMSDGGPGFLGALSSAHGVAPVAVATSGPHGEPLAAQLLVVPGSVPTAYIEAAQCCGLSMAPVPRQPLGAGSAGVVKLLEAAIDSGASRLVVGVGGTASTDGGRPVVEAFEGRWPDDVELVVATDVENPLLGPAGAARSFAPQKGASDDEVNALEQRLTAWASGSGVDPNTTGAGAGGGLAYGLIRLGARRVSGAALIADAIGLAEVIAGVDLVVTGEGSLDFSSLRGKVVSHVSALAMAQSRPCVVLAGKSSVGRREAAAAGIDEVHSLVRALGEQESLGNPAASVRRVTATIAKAWSRG